MKRLVVKLSALGLLSSLCFAGLNAAAALQQPRLIAKCCSSGDARCCGPHGCFADGDHCTAN
jgi:hypothetical protein